MIEKKKYINYSIKYDKNIDYNFIYDYYKLKNLSKDEINLLLLNKNFIYNIDEYQKVNNICLTFIKIFNNLLQKFDDKTLIKKLLENKNDYILNIDKFKEKYLNLIKKKEKYLNNIHKYKLEIKNINSNDDLIKYFKKSVYNSYININYVGRKNIFIIEEVIEDLKLQKKELKDGISLIIRAKNEEKNIKMCIESVVDLVDEIIFVNNNSTDNTLKIIENLALKYDNIKVYNYFIDVSKVGIEHNNALKNNDFNTLGNYYNWCLSKSRMKNVIKWDADFICIRNNFISMIKNLKIRNKYNNYAVWFSGYTLFINNNNYYINLKSYYNEFRLFSYYNGFKWYDGDLCEFNEPYLNKCSDKIYVYDPIFYELKRTDLDEFDSRSSLIDNRDKNDFNILSNLKNNKSMNNLYNINYNLINYDLNILLIVNSFDFGGSNFFIIELYNYFKTHGYNIKIYTYKLKKNNKNYHKINYYDIFDINEINLINNINNFDYVFLNSFIPNDIKDNISDFKTKFIFITHSDVAYSNKYIKEYNNYFYKIITVNNITKNKLIRLLDIDHSKIYKIINYSNINNDSKIDFNRTKKFGVITRFSEDKNIVMLLFALKKFFNIYNDYLFYLVGYENEYMQNYLLYLIDYLELKNFIKVEGYQNDVKKYYELLDFIILPSVSEGASYNLIESMSYQKLIVVSNVGGNHELLNNNCLYIEYDGIKEYEYDNLYIENYNKQLNLLGYVTINDHKDFYNKFELNVEYDFKNINNIPSIFIEKGTDKFDNDYIDLLKSKWDKNIYNILDSVIKAIKLNDQKKQKIINNNYEYIKNNYNIINYYKNIDDILDLSI